MTVLEPVLEPRGAYSEPTETEISKEATVMNKKFADVVVRTSQIDRRHVQLIIVIISLAMLILGIGAPVDGGGPH
jgi:hypothetical protein